MVDSLSQQRLHGAGYSSVVPRDTLPSYKDYASQFIHRKFKHHHPSGHNCRRLSSQWRDDPHHWPPYLLSFGIDHANQDTEALHFTSNKGKFEKKLLRAAQRPSKLLYAVGVQGTADGQFQFPRAVAATQEGDLVVADSDNHRIQIFNAASVHKISIGSTKGSKTGQFEQPTGIAILPNGNIAVADKENQRVQIMRPKGHVRFIFPTNGKPHSIAGDENYNLFVSTFSREIEMYRKGGKFVRSFPLTGATECPTVSMITNYHEQVIVCDAALGLIRAYSYQGTPVWELEPPACSPGLSMIPVGIAMNPFGDLIVGDALNHTVNLYNAQTGQLMDVLLRPTDDLGSIQSLALTTEGHIAVTEFSVQGLHCLKVFRYYDCTCHRFRPMSAKKGYSTPIPK